MCLTPSSPQFPLFWKIILSLQHFTPTHAPLSFAAVPYAERLQCHMGLSPLTPADFSPLLVVTSAVSPGGMCSCHLEAERKLSGQQRAVLLLQFPPADCPFPPPSPPPSIAGNPKAFPGVQPAPSPSHREAARNISPCMVQTYCPVLAEAGPQPVLQSRQVTHVLHFTNIFLQPWQTERRDYKYTHYI